MIQKELDLILQQGEGYKIEFKESLNNIDKELVAFANSSGGKIFLGITDDEKIKGVKVSNKLKSQIQDFANNCDPKIKVIIEEFENILIINVREGDDKPYRCTSGFYARVGPNSQKLSRDEIIEFFKSEGKVRFDELTVPKFNYPNDFDNTKLFDFLELAGLSKSMKPESVLVNLNVAEEQETELYFNNSGVLFFAKEPQRFIPWSVFTVVLFKDKTGVDVIDRKEVTGSLFEIVDKVMDFVKLYSKVAYRFTGMPQREEIYEYPFEAVREAVINSVMHKDYFEHGHNNILKFFPDRIQIENIWVKPKNFVLGKTVFRRNQLIADLLSRIHFGEKIGSGMGRMKIICDQQNSPYPEVEYTDTHFYLSFNPSREYLKMTEVEKPLVELDYELNERQKKAIDFVKKNGKITNSDYRNLCNVSTYTAYNDLRELAEKNILIRKGSGRSTHYLMII